MKDEQGGATILQMLLEHIEADAENYSLPLSKPAFSPIASAVRGGRYQYGYMIYDRITIATFSEQRWVLSLGTKCLNGPGAQFAADLVAFPARWCQGQASTMVAAAEFFLQRTQFFEITLLIAYANGRLATPELRIAHVQHLHRWMKRFEHKHRRSTRGNEATGSLAQAMRRLPSTLCYSSSFIDLLVRSFKAVLGQPKPYSLV